MAGAGTFATAYVYTMLQTHTMTIIFWQHAIHPTHPSTRVKLINQAIQQTVVVIEIFCVQHRFAIHHYCFCARREHQKTSTVFSLSLLPNS